MRFLYFSILITLFTPCMTQQWQINSTRDISHPNPRNYYDNIEMSGKRVAGIIQYNIDQEGYVTVSKQLIFPQLRTHIDETANKWNIYRGYLKENFKDNVLPHIYAGKRRLIPGRLNIVKIDGTLILEHDKSQSGIAVKRHFYPSTEQALFLEEWTLTNETDSTVNLSIGNTLWDQDRYGPYGKYILTVDCIVDEQQTLTPGSSTSFRINYSARKELDQEYIYRDELTERYFLLDDIHDNLILETPDIIINTLFAFSKVRAAESIFDSKMGIVHSPGGGRYYAGIWANDQAEYSGPFFPYLGLEDGNTAALNAYQQFYQQMKAIPNHDQKLWASYEVNGDLKCCGSDRGDAAMIAYGGLHYLLALGDASVAEQYEPMIDWCLTYCHKHLNDHGVVTSDTDEMEGRIPTGTANLSISSLYYGALAHAIDFYTALDYPLEKINELKLKKDQLEKAIESYFGTTIDGLETYKYFAEHDQLRHWICLPLVVGIHNRKEGTLAGLFEHLWTENGVHVELKSSNPEVSKIFWDRGTLYALRGGFIAGATEDAYEKLKAFSEKRLLGDRAPYVVEAYPEGDMAHLSAESALYCRAITEGMFGIYPTGFDQFSLTPRMPSSWNYMKLRHVQAFGRDFDIEITRGANQLEVTVMDESNEVIHQSKVDEGSTLNISLF